MTQQIEEILSGYLKQAHLSSADLITATETLLKVYKQITPAQAVSSSALNTFISELEAVQRVARKIKVFENPKKQSQDSSLARPLKIT